VRNRRGEEDLFPGDGRVRFAVSGTRHHNRLARLTLIERARTNDEVRRILTTATYNQ